MAAALGKPAWGTRGMTKGDWNRLKGDADSAFAYTVSGFSNADGRYSEDLVTITISHCKDGELRCAESNCPSPSFGRTATTRSEFSTFKHLLAYHSPGLVSVVASSGGPQKRLKQATITNGFFGMRNTSQEEVSRQQAEAHDRRSQEIRSRSLQASEEPPTRTSPSPAQAEPVLMYPSAPSWLINLVAEAKTAGEGSKLVTCGGVSLNLPEGAVNHFPHGISEVIPSLSTLYFDAKTGAMRSRECELAVFVDDINDQGIASFTCNACDDLSRSELVRRLVERAWDPDLHSTRCTHRYLTTHQMRERSNLQRKNLLKCTLALLGRDRQLSVLMRQRDLHKQAGVAATIALVNKAIAGLYKPKQYDDEDIDEDLLSWRLGGPRLLYAQNHGSKGSASASTMRRRTRIPRYVTMAADIDMATVRQNYDRFVFSEEHDPDHPCLWRLLMDDCKGEKRLRVDEFDSRVRGACFHAHTNHLSLEIKSENDIDAIKLAMDNDQVHYASEITTVAIGPIREKNYSIKVIATSGGCLRRDPPERTRQLLEAALTVWERDPRGREERGALTTLQPDGAPSFVRISQNLFFSNDMDSTHMLYSTLSPLVLFCLKTGTGIYKNVTGGCEQKHTMKRLRERLKGSRSVKIGSHAISGGMLRRLLVASDSYDSVSLDDMFATGFVDAMNVPATVAFHRAIASLRGRAIDDFGNRRTLAAQLHGDLELLGLLCHLCATLVADKRPSLSEHLTNISTTMHILFAAQRRNKTDFLANQTYLNQQRMLRSIYWSVATAIKMNVSEYYIYQDSGDALENIFNITRAMFSGSGFDVMQFGERAGCAMQVDAVFARRPELRRSVRHLATTTASGSDDHQNPKSFLSTPGGGEDRDRVDVSKVNLSTTFFNGRRVATAALRAAGYSHEEVDFDSIKKSDKNIDFLRPCGSWIGVSVDDEDENADADTDVAPTEEQEEEEDAAVELEEELGPLPEDDGGKQPTLRRIVMAGEDVTIAKALRLKMRLSPEGMLERGRVARNRNQLTAGAVRRPGLEDDAEAEVELNAGEDPLLGIVATLNAITVAILMPTQFITKNGAKVSSMRAEQFNASGVRVACTVVKALARDSQNLTWIVGGAPGERLELDADQTCMVNPVLAVEDMAPSNQPRQTQLRCSLPVAAVEKAGLLLYETWNAKEQGGRSPLARAVSAFNALPYRSPSGEILVVLGDADDNVMASAPNVSAAEQKRSRRIKCAFKQCTEEFDAGFMRQHVAYHLSHKDNRKLDAPCGLCGVNSAAQYGSEHLGCTAWLEKSKTTYKPRHQCKVIGTLAYSHACAKKFAKGSPSTNHIIMCPECPKKPMAQYFWKYRCMEEHWKRAHSSVTMPASLVADLKIEGNERAELKNFASASVKSQTKKRRAAQ